MVWALIASLLLIAGGSAPQKVPPKQKPQVVRVSADAISSYESDPGQEILELTNQARARAGLAPLQLDAGLSQAAQQHAAEMASLEELSHQFPGEPSLTQRLAASTVLHLDRAGENVVYAGSPERVQQVLVNSTPHRENMLNPGFNVIGIGVVRSENILYVVQDFGYALPNYSNTQADDAVANAVNQMRAGRRLTPVRQVDGATARSAACAMAQADSLSGSAVQARYLLRYTAMHPEDIPGSVSQVIDDPGVRAFAAGTCYARTPSYPNGAYWVVLLFY